ncbi:MAG: S8 family serine peptidase [Candidatus Kapabacteria bacterium]|nr:S8 family serine peptidase [Candidatus Kapabacteria bacterium]
MNGLFNPSTPTKNFGSFSLCSTLPADRQTGRPADRQIGKINWYKQTLLFAFLMILISAPSVFSQFQYPVQIDDFGDTLMVSWPPPDSSYIKNEIIVKFKSSALNLNLLCFNWMFEENNENSKKVEKTMFSNVESIYSYLQNERFNINELVVDSNLRSYLHSIGADTLSRITFANPCMDTISITRNGDTIGCEDYLFLALHLSNDTSVVNGIVNLNWLYRENIYGASFNFYKELYSITIPDDLLYSSHQKNLTRIGMPIAWDHNKGTPNTKVGVIDNGIYYDHCDLGKGFGVGKKVRDGWNFVDRNIDIRPNSTHGTQISGIIGAYTNYNECVADPYSIAGIAGGWNGPDENIGVLLYGLKTNLTTAQTIGAIRLASTLSGASVTLPNETIVRYGYGCDIINLAYGGKAMDVQEQTAINWAYENKVVVVAARGNYTSDITKTTRTFPSGWEGQKVISVGGANQNLITTDYSLWSGLMDVIAPAGDCSQPNNEEEYFYSTINLNEGYSCFDGTSMAAAQVSGFAALIHQKSKSEWPDIKMEPEDYQGLISSSALDINTHWRTNNYYDDFTGYGHIQLDNFYNMLSTRYTLEHIGDWDNFTFGPWSTQSKYTVLDDSPKTKPLKAGDYIIQTRQINTSKVYNNPKWIVNSSNPAYVWTRGGDHDFVKGKENTGFNGKYQINMSGIASGIGGDDFRTNMRVHFNETGFTDRVKIQTVSFQYKFLSGPGIDPNNPILIPETNNIRTAMSIFVRYKPENTSVVSNSLENNGFEVSQLLGGNTIKITSFDNSNLIKEIIIYNLVGTNVGTFQVNNNEYDLSIEHLVSGFYSVIVTDKNNQSYSYPLQVIR